MPLVVEERAAGTRGVAEHDLGQHDAVVPGRDAADDPAHQPGGYVVEDGNAFGARTPCGGRSEAVGAALGEGGRQVLLVFAEYVDADVVGRRYRRPAGGAGADSEG